MGVAETDEQSLGMLDEAALETHGTQLIGLPPEDHPPNSFLKGRVLARRLTRANDSPLRV
jgi:hypothetical protein